MSHHSQAILTVLYPKTSKFDMSYYLSHHIPTTTKAWEPLGMTSCIVAEVEDDADYVVKVLIGWKDLASWEKAKEGTAAKELGEDVKNFTDVTPVMIVGKIVSASKV
jgi:uncharacterized protein (TIGR02118 family)